MARALFIGIDLTSSPKRPTACVGLGEKLHLIFDDLLSSDGDILGVIASHRPCIVAIDAPIGLPKGLCCLEDVCSCRALLPGKGRICERELSRRGIPCYYTTKKSIIKNMVYRAISLKREIVARGCEVIEVYPYATKVALFGKPIPSKLEPAGIAFLRECLGCLMPHNAPQISGFNHDLCDALIAAYTAYLYAQGEAEVMGDLEEGAICVPAFKGVPFP